MKTVMKLMVAAVYVCGIIAVMGYCVSLIMVVYSAFNHSKLDVCMWLLMWMAFDRVSQKAWEWIDRTDY